MEPHLLKIKKALIAEIEAKESEFLIEAAIQYRKHLLYTFHSTTGVQQSIFRMYRANPNKGDKIIAVLRAIHSKIINEHKWGATISADEKVIVLESIQRHYHKAIRAIKLPKKLIPPKAYTDHISEAIARGFIFMFDELGGQTVDRNTIKIYDTYFISKVSASTEDEYRLFKKKYCFKIP